MKHWLFLGVLLLAGCGGGANPQVEIETSAGKIKVELYQDKAPATVANFLRYVDAKHYDGTIFHRVIKDFMIQGGGFTPDMKEKATQNAVKNEADNGLSNLRGTLSMARTSDPNSATAQFFINVKDNAAFDMADSRRSKGGYCVFGRVLEGLEVVDAIRIVETGERGGHDDVPLKDVLIKSIRRIDVK